MKHLKNLSFSFVILSFMALSLVLTGCPSTSLDAPTNVSATDGAYSDTVVVTWNAVTGGIFGLNGANYYKVFRSVDQNIFLQAGGDVIGTTYEDSDIEPGTVYYYKVKAFTSDGTESEYSDSDEGWAFIPEVPSITIDEYYDLFLAVIAVAGEKIYSVVPNPPEPPLDETIPGDVGGECQFTVTMLINPDFTIVINSVISFTDYNDGELGLDNNEGGMILNGELVTTANADLSGSGSINGGTENGIINTSGSQTGTVESHVTFDGETISGTNTVTFTGETQNYPVDDILFLNQL